MIVDERMVTYINSLDMGNTPLLNEIEKEAKADLVPVIRREMQSFLKSAPCDSPAPSRSGGGNGCGLLGPSVL